jgi:hypothetical protein
VELTNFPYSPECLEKRNSPKSKSMILHSPAPLGLHKAA